MGPAGISRSEQIARRIENKAAARIGTIGAGETGQRDHRAIAARGLRQFEHRALAIGTPGAGRAKQIARRIGDQAAKWCGAIGPGKAGQCDKRAITRGAVGQFEYGAIVIGAACTGRAEQIARSVGDQAARGIRAVGARKGGKQ